MDIPEADWLAMEDVPYVSGKLRVCGKLWWLSHEYVLSEGRIM